MDEAFYRRLADHAGVPYVDAGSLSAAAAATLTSAAARSFEVIPVADDGRTLVLATPDPAMVDIAALGALTGRRISLAVAAPAAVARELARAFPPSAAHASSGPPPASASEKTTYRRLAHHAGLDFVELDHVSQQSLEQAANLLGATACSALQMLPVAIEKGTLVVATDEPGDDQSVSIVAALTGLRLRLVIATPADLARAIERVFATVEGVTAAPGATEPRRLGALLVAAGLISESQLAEALSLQLRTGDRLGQVLLHMGAIDESGLARAFARQRSLPELDIAHFEPDSSSLRVVPESLARRHRFAPVAIRDHVLYLASADILDADTLAELREHTALPIQTIITQQSSVDQLLQRIYKREYTELATVELLNRHPAESAYRRLTLGQRLVGLCLIGVAVLLGLDWPIQALIGFNVVAMLFYTSFSIYKFFLIARAVRHDLELPVTQADLATLDPRELPVYSILVPLYREAAVVGRLVDSIARLDYPPTKLDVKLLVEEDDDETLAKLQGMALPAYFKLVVVPDSRPKTKPKACNYGLIQVEGKYVVIYDAEDRPDPDQLKKIVFAFSRVEERVVCIQCKLNYFNRTQNVLTRWFTAEYSHWFDLLMPGLDAADAPIPLGGTSNHFIVEKLIELGAWDPYNVTEDADLGIRLHKAGYKTGIVDSTTFEEANSDLYNWIRQRSRWVKGYIQTWLVHMRHPFKLYRQIGWRSWWSFQFIIAGTFVSFLLNPVYWGLTTLWVMTKAHFIQQIFPTAVYYPGAVGLFIGNFVFTYVNVAGCMRRSYPDLVKYALLSPIYWALMSVGAWKGALQLLYRPHYWEKTVHGLDVGVEPEFVHPTTLQ